ILMARKHKDEAQEIKYNAQTGVAIDRDWDHCFQNYLPLIGSTLMSEDVASEAKICKKHYIGKTANTNKAFAECKVGASNYFHALAIHRGPKPDANEV
ncbi:hypothetical protein HDU99_009373, partial [Rhizoclosmatium hyalinum]